MKILFCSDGTVQAEKAAWYGVIIAAAYRADVSILGIVRKAGDEKNFHKDLKATLNIFKEKDLGVELITKVGKPVHEIIKHTRETHYDLMIIGAVRKNPISAFLNPLWRRVSALGVPAYKIIAAAELPVLMVIGNYPELRRFLICSAGDPNLDQAVEFAGEIAKAVKAEVDLFHVMQEPPAVYAELIRIEEAAERLLESNSKLGRTLRRQKDLLEKIGVFGKLLLTHGSVVQELQKELHQTAYDMLVLGSSSSKGRLSKLAMGDLTREIVEQSELPVLVMQSQKKSSLVSFLRELPGRLRSLKSTEDEKEDGKSE
ncbi:MAG: universal stress protein [Deltaproteobacteria bacterium]|nr:universal stress protein [Deltaproteobacteria bacterium]